MKVAYLDCASGISGDMTLGALVDAGADLGVINAGVQSLGLPGVRLVRNDVKKKGFRATQITVEHEPQHKHRHLHHIAAMIDGGALSARQKELAMRVFTRLGEAEAKVHGTTIEKVHFHEVGAIDSIADIVGSAIGWDLLGIERAVCSPVPTGTGFVEIAHGRCSIPAPATGELLRGIPLVESAVPFELTTPTGAALIGALCTSFGPPPAMKIDSIGYGAGQRDLEQQPNLLRLLVGEAPLAEGGATGTAGGPLAEQIWLLETNLDDLSGELIGYAIEKLWQAGALDVVTTFVQMKKNRPGVTLSILCQAPQCDALEAILFSETTTLGVRRQPVWRHTLRRETHRVETPWGPVEGMLAWPAGEAHFSPEFESCRRMAEEHRLPLRTVYDAARKAFRP